MDLTVQRIDLPFFPSFFLVGAPRCGTTSISKYLARQPQVCFSRPKEPHYFNRATVESLARIRAEYLDRYFPHYDPQQHSVVGEGSVSYLYQPEAIRRILALAPDARFIVAVRNPIDMLRSYHYRMLYLLEEDTEDFIAAWNLQEARAHGEGIPPRCSDPRLLLYREVASLGKQVRQLQELAGADHCHVIVNDDLKNKPGEVYRDLLHFIGVDDGAGAIPVGEDQVEFPQRLRSKSYRWRWLHVLLYKPPAAVVKTVERSEVRRKGRPSALKRLRKRLLKFNRLERDPPPFHPDTRAMLRETLAEDMATLGALIGRDLSHWR